MDLVIRSKIMDVIGHEPTDQEIRDIAVRIETPDGWEYVSIKEGASLIGWSFDKFKSIRFDGKSVRMYIEYKV